MSKAIESAKNNLIIASFMILVLFAVVMAKWLIVLCKASKVNIVVEFLFEKIMWVFIGYVHVVWRLFLGELDVSKKIDHQESTYLNSQISD